MKKLKRKKISTYIPAKSMQITSSYQRFEQKVSTRPSIKLYWELLIPNSSILDNNNLTMSTNKTTYHFLYISFYRKHKKCSHTILILIQK